MSTIIGMKGCLAIHQTQLGSEMNRRTATIATQALRAVAVEIFKIKMKQRMVFDKHHTICANTKPTIADLYDLFFGERQLFFTIVNHYKVVAVGLIFIKMNVHGLLLREKEMTTK